MIALAVAHGSKDPAAQERVHALARRAAGLLDGVPVRAAFVQNAQPSLPDALARATATGERVVVVPLLLSAGYHLSVDIGHAAAAAGVPVAGALGPDARLVLALVTRLAQAGVPAGTPVVLAAAGSSDPQAAADTRRQAELLAACLRAPVTAAFASAARPTVPEAVAELTARTGRPVAVATYLLAPGQFHDRLRGSGAAWVSAPLGDHPAVAAVVAERFRAAARIGGHPWEPANMPARPDLRTARRGRLSSTGASYCVAISRAGLQNRRHGSLRVAAEEPAVADATAGTALAHSRRS